MKERSRVSGKTLLTRLSVDEAVEALGVEIDVLRKRIREGSIPHERDEHGLVYVLVGAYSNVPDSDHSRQREPRDEAMIGALQSQAAHLRSAPWPPEGVEAPPEIPEPPEDPA
ncbi:MAG: hypothetical protein H0U55_15020 [Rubrobacteraceae bacterium]|nr:hypothetical protein [Rubrobacteraceae bacterium]